MLHPIEFNAQDLAHVQDFDCGNEPWEMEVSNWLKAPSGQGGALDDILNLGAKVWLYQEQGDGALVGVGSLGLHTVRYKNPKKGPPTPTFVIPGLGLARAFWGKPKGDEKNRYSRQVMNHLIETARAEKAVNDVELIMLVVHKANTHAIKLYREYNFEDHGPKDANYNRMVAVL